MTLCCVSGSESAGKYLTCQNCKSCQPGISSMECCVNLGLVGDGSLCDGGICCKYRNGNQNEFVCTPDQAVCEICAFSDLGLDDPGCESSDKVFTSSPTAAPNPSSMFG